MKNLSNVLKFLLVFAMVSSVIFQFPMVSTAAMVDVIQFTPGDSAETPYLTGADQADLLEHGSKFRLAEGSRYFTYMFSKPQGTMAMVTLTLANQYKVSVSTDGTNFTQVLDGDTNGTFKEDRTLDLTSYYASSGNVYLKFQDLHPSDGWGGQLWYLKFQSIAPGSTPANMKLDISNGWSVSIDGGAATTKNAGDIISMTSTARYTKAVSIPSWWNGQPISLTFAGVTGNGTIYVDGVQKGVALSEQQPFTYTITNTEMADNTINIVVDVYGTTSGGLWKSVLIGFTDLVSPVNLATRNLGTTTVKISNQYNHKDTVTMNWMGGNYMQSLYDNRYKLIGFDDYTRKKELYYVHDTLRSMSAIAEEDRYSPIVRYDLLKNLYTGVKYAQVPDSSYEFFLKRDKRPKKIRADASLTTSLELNSDQDVTEPYANVRFWGKKSDNTTIDSASSSVSDGGVTYSSNQYSFRRTWTASGANVYADVKYWDGDQDKPSEIKFSTGTGVSQLTAVVDKLDQRWHGARYTQVEFEGGTNYNVSSGSVALSNPTAKYLILKSVGTGWVKSILVVWDGSPALVRVNASADNAYFYSIELTYNAWGTGVTTKFVPFEWFDPNMSWPRKVAGNIKTNGTYGAKGFDPTYSCNLEGLGPMGIAAAAQIFKKYSDPLASEAEALAKSVTDGLINADGRGAKANVLNGPIAACEYLVLAGNSSYTTQLRTWADRVIANQAADGTWNWYDLQTRNMLALLRAYRCTGDSKYLNAYNKARSSMTYNDTSVTWKGSSVTASLPLHGGADLGYLGFMGDWTPLGKLFNIQDWYNNDSGIWNCSDINPYFVGFSLKGCAIVANDTAQRAKLTMTQYVKYGQNGQGSYTTLRYPTQYINNPNYGF